MSTDDNATPRAGGAHDQAKASDSFGVAKTIPPNNAIRRRPSGRVDFPGGVTLVAPESREDSPVHVQGLGFVSEGVAATLVASMTGALIELAEQREREARRVASGG